MYDRRHGVAGLPLLASLALALPPSVGLAQPAASEKPAAKGVRSPRPSSDDTTARITTLERALEQMRNSQQAQAQQMKQLQRKSEQQAGEILQMEAESEAAAGGAAADQADEESNVTQQDFKGGQRALQALNPELSVVGDLFAKGVLNRHGYRAEDDRSGFVFRGVGIHLQSTLDPFSFAKFAVVVSPEGVELEEGYVTWTSVLPGLSLTLGRFRQEFGVVNRWHDESLDQVDYPLALTEILGDDGLAQTGVSLEYLVPKFWAATHHLLLQVTNGESDHLFAGKFFSLPALLLRLKSYFDLSESTYFELGLTGMLGWNNARGKADEQGQLVDEPWRKSWLWGADWTLSWVPLRQAKYHGLVARGEFYGARKQLAGGEVAQAVGLYQYLQARLSQSWEGGVRFDWSKPLASDNAGTFIWGVVPYLTWWQSEWVRARLQYAWTRSDLAQTDDHRVLLQATFAVGPHKHERY